MKKNACGFLVAPRIDRVAKRWNGWTVYVRWSGALRSLDVAER